MSCRSVQTKAASSMSQWQSLHHHENVVIITACRFNHLTLETSEDRRTRMRSKAIVSGGEQTWNSKNSLLIWGETECRIGTTISYHLLSSSLLSPPSTGKRHKKIPRCHLSASSSSQPLSRTHLVIDHHPDRVLLSSSLLRT